MMGSIFKEEALQYFGKRAFTRLFSLMKEKMESRDNNGGGTVKFIPFEGEREALVKWFGEPFPTDFVSVSLDKFEKRLLGSKYENIGLSELIELVTAKPLISKKEKIENQEKSKNSFFQSLIEKYPHPNVEQIIDQTLKKGKGPTGFIISYNEGDYHSIEMALKAVSHLPEEGRYERLPIFAERITGNPHYFDKNKKLYQALELLLSEKEGRSYRSKLNAENEVDLLSLVGLAKDDLHSFVTVYGLNAYRGNQIIQQWKWANHDLIVQNIPLRSLKNIDTIKPASGNNVFVIENSGVYSSIIDELDDIYPVVCTHGNFKLSGLILLDKLVKSGAHIYYSGDLDANGIFLARYLKQKYGEQMHYWRMSVEDYQKSVSDIELTKLALKRLESIIDWELTDVIQKITEEGRAGYQEPLINNFIMDIKQRCKE
jgi:uncharacterized protein (TIGR02679 family)